MVFFGASSTPAPAPGTSGFSLPSVGTTPAPGAPAPAGGLLFGSAPAASTPAPAPGGFGPVGSTPAPAAAPTAPAPGASAPAVSGYNFSATPAPAAPAPAAPGAAPGGLSFGSTAPAPAAAGAPVAPGATPAPAFNFANPSTPAPAAGGLNFGGNTSSTTATTATSSTPLAPSSTTTPAPAAGPPPTLKAPIFEDIFGNFKVWTLVQKWSQQDSDLAGQELIHLIETHKTILQPTLSQWKQPNAQLRQQLGQRPIVEMNYKSSGPVESTLTRRVLERIGDLSSDLRISEEDATCLYAQVTSEMETIQGIAPFRLLEQAGVTKKLTPTTRLAREFYFYERHLKLQTLLFLFQSRLSNDPKILRSTDILLEEGLINNLIKIIMDYTQRIIHLMQEVSGNNTAPGLMGATLPGNNTAANAASQVSFAQAHLLFCQQERQVAAEILLFIAYHTQLLPAEMAALLDLIKNMNPLLPEHCPFTNVPSPYENTPTAPAQTTWPSQAPGSVPFQYPLKEKSFFVWQQELVANVHKSGQPQALQCVSVLVVTAIAAMDTKQVLYDRATHAPFTYRGNAFLPPDAQSHSTPGVTEIHKRLSTQAITTQWGRKDIGGLLSAAFVLMLRSAPALLGSPRGGAHSEIRQAARDLSTAADLKSFTFCRLTLLPALQRLPSSQVCKVSEFALSVVAETFAQYLEMLDGQLPMSRRRWLLEEEDQLRLRRDAQARKRQFSAWEAQGYGSNNGLASSSKAQRQQEEVIPSSVDLMTRPDCLDDIVALATDLCALAPEYARNFWSTDPFTGNISPSRTLLALESEQSKDDSVLPSYLSWLAALASDVQSTELVFKMLSAKEPAFVDSFSSPTASAAAPSTPTTGLSWTKILYNLRWYAQELSPYDTDGMNKPPTRATSTQTPAKSTAYYYLDEDAQQDTSNTKTTSSSATSSSSNNKIKELSDETRFFLSSHLAIIRNVCHRSNKARYELFKISLPLGDRASFGADEALGLLMTLAIAPLPPTVRGATLGTIAMLLAPSEEAVALTEEENKFISEKAKTGWEYLEACPLLPIALLDQYGVLNPANMDSRSRINLGFPPSSATLANSQSVETILPKDPSYGLIYEMEHVESQMGFYPSTEGFLELLHALISTAGCPETLGQNFRLRPGVAPYVEYVTDFILPRILGIGNVPQLPFRVKGDQSRLTTKALAVVQEILSQYEVPSWSPETKAQPGDVKELLGIPSIFASSPTRKLSESQALSDFRTSQLSTTTSAPMYSLETSAIGTTDNSGATSIAPSSSIPRPKSSAFAILSDILSADGGIIFQALAMILTDQGGATGVKEVFGAECDAMALSYAVFGSTPPSRDSAKEGAKEGGPTRTKQHFLKALTPSFEDFVVDNSIFDDAVSWREKAILAALQIFCSVAIHEEAFSEAVNAARDAMKVVPVLRFQKIRYGSSNLRVVNVALSRLVHRLYGSTNSEYIRGALVGYVGYKATDHKRDAALAGAATGLTFFMQQRTPSTLTLKSLCGNQDVSVLSKAFSTRLVASASYPDVPLHSEITSLILGSILDPLRASRPTDGFVGTLLGLPSATANGNWKPGDSTSPTLVSDCLDAIFELSRDSVHSATRAACMEIVFRLYNLFGRGDAVALRVAIYSAERARSIDFWTTNLLEWLSHRGSERLKEACPEDVLKTDPSSLHCVAWLLKGVACELNMLAGFTSDSNFLPDSSLATLLHPKPDKFHQLVDILFGTQTSAFAILIDTLSLKRVSVNPSLASPPSRVLKLAVKDLPGPKDVVEGYYIVSEDRIALGVGHSFKGAMKRWCHEWNLVVSRDCAISHVTSGIFNVIDAVVSSAESLATSLASAPILSSTSIMSTCSSLVQVLLAEANQSGMDDMMYPNATKNLANAALLLSSSISGHNQDDSAYHSWASSNLARAVVFSSIGNSSDAETPMRYERTTVLASALSLELRAVAKNEPNLVYQHREDFLNAAQVLARLSSFPVKADSDDSSSVVSVLARSSLKTVIDVCCIPEEEYATSFLFRFLSMPNLQPFFELVSHMDVDIAGLLRTVALQPFGADILIDGGICRVLASTAMEYAKEEAEIVSQIDTSRTGYNEMKVVSPIFLMGHLKLLGTMMSSKALDPQKLRLLSNDVLDILKNYNGVFRRLCFNFPIEGDLLRSFMQCFMQAATLAKPADSTMRQRELSSSARRSFNSTFEQSGFIEGGILVLCEQLMTNPLPSSFIPTLPQGLRTTEKESIGTVQVESSKDQSWWDVLDMVLAQKNAPDSLSFRAPIGSNDFGYWGGKTLSDWSENKFEYALIASEILMLGLSILKKLNKLSDLNAFSIARGIHQHVLAIQTVNNRLREVQFSLEPNILGNAPPNADTTALEVEYLRMHCARLASCIEQLLITSHVVSPVESKENAPDSAGNIFRLAIEQSGLDTKGIEFLSTDAKHSRRIEMINVFIASITGKVV